MEQQHSAFPPQPNILSGGNRQGEHHAHLPSPSSLPSPFGSFPRPDHSRQGYSTEGYPKDAFGRDFSVRLGGTDSFPSGRGDSFAADGLNFGAENFSTDRESVAKDSDLLHTRGVGGDSRVSYAREPENCTPSFVREKDSLSSEERSSKKFRRGGWWNDPEPGERPSEIAGAPREMESIRQDADAGATVASFVGPAGGIGAFRSVGQRGTGVSLGNSGTGGGDDGCAEVGGVGGLVVAVGRGASTDGEVGPAEVRDGTGSCAGTGIDVEATDDGDNVEGWDGDSRDKGEKDFNGKKKRAELWQDAEMDALVSAYRHIHMRLAVAGKKGKHLFKSANEKWKEVRNLLLPLGVDRQPKEIERKWSNLSTAFKQISDWNKKVGKPSYWELDEALKKEKTKAKELPATFRVQLYEAMAEFLGDRTATRRSRGWTQYEGSDRPPLMLEAGNLVSGGSECSSGVVDIPLPLDKLACQIVNDPTSQKRTRVVLVAPGSFNPPTYMHLRMFELARDALMEDGFEVIGGYMSPVNDAYGKKGLASADHRIRLCQLACSDSSFIMVDPWEAKQSSYQRTLTVLNRVDHAINSHGYGNDVKVRVMLLCGADLVESFTTPGVWIPDQVQTLCREHGIVCISREGKDLRKIVFESDLLYELRKRFIIVDEAISNNISSTKIRRNLARGLSIKYLTPDNVISYVSLHHLYDQKQS
ncbi:hypothetical protein R1sor_013468 [Riccia sorocarpa]|uniref:Nicotinamide/nicotinic acid mononucleotide adenylyltransferase n=1 Tax=Riccia sorocarpa TaxID=122646 RepID=A0ABD3HAI0_9MARC